MVVKKEKKNEITKTNSVEDRCPIKKNPVAVLVFLSVIFLCVSMVSGAFLLSKTDFYIKNIGTATTEDGKLANTISVSGNGKAYARPDMATISVTIQETENTSKEALREVNEKIDEIKEVLEKNGIEDKYVKTTSLSIYPEYDYSKDKRIVVGQRASQTLTFSVLDIDAEATKAAKIIDKVSEIDNIQIGNIYFDIEDKTSLYTAAREAAFDKAEQKAGELAGLGDLRLLKPVSISDINRDYAYYPAQSNTKMMYDEVEGGSYSDTQISTGQMEVTIDLSVVFGIE